MDNAIQLTFSSPSDLVTPGLACTPAGLEPPSRVVTSNLDRVFAVLISKGLKRSRTACKAALRCTRFCAPTPDFTSWRFFFFDCWGPSTPVSRREAFSCFNCDGGMAAWESRDKSVRHLHRIFWKAGFSTGEKSSHTAFAAAVLPPLFSLRLSAFPPTSSFLPRRVRHGLASKRSAAMAVSRYVARLDLFSGDFMPSTCH